MDTLGSRLITSTDCLDWSSINIKQSKNWLTRESGKQRGKSPSHFCWNCSGCSYSKGLLGFTTDLLQGDCFSQECHSMADLTEWQNAAGCRHLCSSHSSLQTLQREGSQKKKESKVHLQKYPRRSPVFQTLPSVFVDVNQRERDVTCKQCPPTQQHSHPGFKVHRVDQVQWWSCRNVLAVLEHSKQGPKLTVGWTFTEHSTGVSWVLSWT